MDNNLNCNTCRHLIREERNKCWYGFIWGICAKGNEKHTPYYADSTFFMFHPEDYMGMKCWEPRGHKEK